MHCIVEITGFSVTQILREINFGEPKSSKTAVFATFGVLNFVNLVNFSLQEKMKLQFCAVIISFLVKIVQI